jgi:hypothetical protein
MPTSLDLPHGVALFFWRTWWDPEREYSTTQIRICRFYDLHLACHLNVIGNGGLKHVFLGKLSYIELQPWHTVVLEELAHRKGLPSRWWSWRSVLYGYWPAFLWTLDTLAVPIAQKLWLTPTHHTQPFYVRMFHLNNQRLWDTPRKAEKIWKVGTHLWGPAAQHCAPPVGARQMYSESQGPQGSTDMIAIFFGGRWWNDMIW